MYKVYSNAYITTDVDNYNCYINQTEYNKLQDMYNSRKLFARIKNGDDFWICSVGAPIVEEHQSLYVPYWMLEQINTPGDGELLEVDFIPSEIFDPTTKIILQAHIAGFETENIQEVLSNELTKLGILKKNTTIYIHNYDLDIDVAYNVVDIEPASVSLCDGDDVVLDFIESLDTIARPPTPYPFESLPTVLLPDMVVEDELDTTVVEPIAPILGGVRREGRFNPWRNKDFKPNTSS